MRLVLAALAFMGIAWLAQPVQADPYRYCAVYGGNDGRESCYFRTFQECLASIQGNGGFCNNNPWYTGPAANGGSRKRTRR
jgi:hypothetical protein